MSLKARKLPEHQRLANAILELSRARIVRNQNFTWSLRMRGRFEQEHFDSKHDAEHHRIKRIQLTAENLVRILPRLEAQRTAREQIRSEIEIRETRSTHTMSETVAAYIIYQWDCTCGEVNQCDQDPNGELLECSACGDEYEVHV